MTFSSILKLKSNGLEADNPDFRLFVVSHKQALIAYPISKSMVLFGTTGNTCIAVFLFVL